MTDAKQALEVGMALQRLLDVAHSAARGPDHIGPTQHAHDMNRLRHVLDQDGSALSEAASLLSSLAEENERLRSCVVSFLAPWAVRYADDFGLPKGHLHASHYDLLVECGARMDDFTRHPLTTHPAQPEGEGHE